MSKYPKYGPAQQGKAYKLLPGLRTEIIWAKDEEPLLCETCKQPINPNEQIIVQEVQVDWFRGNDEVNCYHEKCWKKRK